MTRITNPDLFGGETSQTVEDNPRLPDAMWRERFVARFLRDVHDDDGLAEVWGRRAAIAALDLVKERHRFSHPEEAAVQEWDRQTEDSGHE